MKESPLLALAQARIKSFFREPGAVFWTFGFPLLITVALGVAFRNQGPGRATVAVVGGADAPAMARALDAHAEVRADVEAAARAAARLRTGDVLLIVEAPDRAGAPIVYRFDPTRPEASAARRTVDDILQRGAGRVDPRPTRDETAIASGARYIDWLVPGLLGMQLLAGALWGTAFNVVDSRQKRLLKRLAATPMRRTHFLLSYRLAGLLFVPLQVFVIFTFARLVFGVRIHGSPVAVVLLAFLGSWTFAGIGLLCASRAQNTETANGLVNLVTLPMYVLSGVFFRASRFPDVLQPAIHLLPLTAFNDAVRHVVNDGASIFAQGPQIAVLAVWGLLTSTLALRLFRWT